MVASCVQEVASIHQSALSFALLLWSGFCCSLATKVWISLVCLTRRGICLLHIWSAFARYQKIISPLPFFFLYSCNLICPFLDYPNLFVVDRK
jgi:hypothetical protein